MFVNLIVSNVAADSSKLRSANTQHFVMNACSDPDKVILQPGRTFRNITNNTSEPMDITGIIATLDKQLETRLC